MLNFSKNDKARLNLRWCRNFFFVRQVKGAERGNERAKADSLTSLLAHPLLPFLRGSFTSFAESPSAPSAVNPFAGSTQSSLCFLQVTGFSTSQPAHAKEELVAANMDKVIFLTAPISATQRSLLPLVIQLETHFKAIQTQGNLKFPSKSKAYRNIFKSFNKQAGKTVFPLKDHFHFSWKRDLNIWNTHKIPKGKLNVQFTFWFFFPPLKLTFVISLKNYLINWLQGGTPFTRHLATGVKKKKRKIKQYLLRAWTLFWITTGLGVGGYINFQHFCPPTVKPPFPTCFISLEKVPVSKGFWPHSLCFLTRITVSVIGP